MFTWAENNFFKAIEISLRFKLENELKTQKSRESSRNSKDISRERVKECIPERIHSGRRYLRYVEVVSLPKVTKTYVDEDFLLLPEVV